MFFLPSHTFAIPFSNNIEPFRCKREATTRKHNTGYGAYSFNCILFTSHLLVQVTQKFDVNYCPISITFCYSIIYCEYPAWCWLRDIVCKTNNTCRNYLGTRYAYNGKTYRRYSAVSTHLSCMHDKWMPPTYFDKEKIILRRRFLSEHEMLLHGTPRHQHTNELCQRFQSKDVG